MYIVLDTINGVPTGNAQLITKEQYEATVKHSKVGRSTYIILTVEQYEKLPDEMKMDKRLKQYVKKLKKNG